MSNRRISNIEVENVDSYLRLMDIGVAGRILSFLLLFLFLNSPTLSAQIPCATEQITARNDARFPQLNAKRLYLQHRMEAVPVATGRSVVTIPVVVHVVYKGNLENISDQQIYSQLEVLNKDYRRLNDNANTVPAIFAPLAADVELEFCLATIDPTGQPATGITRRETSWSDIGQLLAPDGRPRINYTALGGEDAWDTQHYLNIWVCGIGGGILGFGTAPGTTIPEEDGVVVDARFFGTTGLAALHPPHHLGRTATHEIGHYFNLKHIWGGNGDSCDDDDDVDDTPVQRSAYQGCPVHPQLSCGNTAMFMNFMDYTDDACMSLFTLGQKARVWAALEIARPGLLDGDRCSVIPVITPESVAPLQLWPNPAGSVLLINRAEPLPAGCSIRIFDALGRLRMSLQQLNSSGSQLEIDVSSFPAGVYLLVIYTENEASVVQFLKCEDRN